MLTSDGPGQADTAAARCGSDTSGSVTQEIGADGWTFWPNNRTFSVCKPVRDALQKSAAMAVDTYPPIRHIPTKC